MRLAVGRGPWSVGHGPRAMGHGHGSQVMSWRFFCRAVQDQRSRQEHAVEFEGWGGLLRQPMLQEGMQPVHPVEAAARISIRAAGPLFGRQESNHFALCER
mmetsp:Transcript_81524/g.264120  ORF Transcript_81524/g.264120 Transcript_81524/m.264120 type:complete len:101 (-) Transcript_81524:51-353(-)